MGYNVPSLIRNIGPHSRSYTTHRAFRAKLDACCVPTCTGLSRGTLVGTVLQRTATRACLLDVRDDSSGSGTTLSCSQQRCAKLEQTLKTACTPSTRCIHVAWRTACNCRSCCDQTDRQSQAHGFQIEVLHSPNRSAQINLTLVRRS